MSNDGPEISDVVYETHAAHDITAYQMAAQEVETAKKHSDGILLLRVSFSVGPIADIRNVSNLPLEIQERLLMEALQTVRQALVKK